MCADFKQILDVWLIDCSPTPDFQRSVGVCIVRVSTSHADKLRLAFSVSFIHLSALGACARSVARVNKLNRDARPLCLVEHKAFQLVKRPAVQTTALSFTSPYPDSNSAQVFQSDPTSGAFGSTNYLLRNCVIHVSREPLFFPTTTAHQPFGSLGALLLEFAPKAHVSRSVVVHGRAREPFPVRGVGNRHKTEVNPNPFNNLHLFFVRDINGREKEPFLISVDQVGLTSLKSDQLSVMVSANKGNFQATVKRPDAGEALVHVPGQNAEIIRDRSVLAKGALRIVVNLVGVGNLGVQSDDDLSRQRKLIANRSIERFVQVVLTKLFDLPSQFTETVTGLVGRFQSAQESVRLLGRWLKFYLRGQLDAACFNSILETMQPKKYETLAIPPTPKGVGFLALYL